MTPAPTPADLAFYRGKNVFVTGHTGFKGAWLALWLAKLGARVHGYALPPATPSLFETADVRGVLASHTEADVLDAAALAAAVQNAGAGVVFHLAAQALVRRSYREPANTFAVNCTGTLNLLEAVRASPAVRVCQIVTTDKCYENREWAWSYREIDPLGGRDPYSASKAAAELVVASYRASFFAAPDAASVSSARAGNVIGGGDWAEDRIIVDAVRALEQGEPVGVRNPNAVRPWQHVLEPLGGYLTLAARQWQEPKRFAEAFNFGPLPGGHVTVGDLMDRVIAAWGDGRWQDLSDRSAMQPHEAATLKLDVTKADALLGWRPRWTVDEAVRQTVRWYAARHRQTNFDAAALCRDQIDAYENATGPLSRVPTGEG